MVLAEIELHVLLGLLFTAGMFTHLAWGVQEWLIKWADRIEKYFRG